MELEYEADPQRMINRARTNQLTPGGVPEDLSREVYCILGIPIDAIDMASTVSRIEAASAEKQPFLISTSNLNFLVNSLSDSTFRESLLLSDLCLADGMPILWIARLLGLPIKYRVAGSDLFDAIKAKQNQEMPLKVFLFGGNEGVAAAASRALNARPSGLCCVGFLYPGFGSVEEMSREEIIQDINSSNADFLVASLGAKKGQLWLLHNHHRLSIPVRAHLGAALNFAADALRRAPLVMQKVGLEWLWRIKEEPYLWKRYWTDGSVLLRLLITRILPLIILQFWIQLKQKNNEQNLVVTQTLTNETTSVNLFGSATTEHLNKIVSALRTAIATQKSIVVDLTEVTVIDARFIGLLLMLFKTMKRVGAKASLAGVSPSLTRIFRLYGVGFLLPGKTSQGG
jgi:N-acetylglucosaminyldiphosphoundecaprenol N-acetyl-beta-D-mannosaminyltransferase